MNNNIKFKSDLKDGQYGEYVISEFLKTKGFEIIDFNDDYKYDIMTKLNKRELKFEVKTDRYEFYKKVSTNNLFIETMCSGKFSGIHTTQADYFIYYLPDFEEGYFIKVKDLKELIKTPGLKVTEQSGDDGRVRGILINRKDEYLRGFFKVYTIPKDKFY